MVGCARRSLLCFVAGGGLLVAATGPVSAAPEEIRPDFALAVGYAQVSLDGANSAIDGEGALRLDGQWSLSPLPSTPQLRLGAALGVAMVLEGSAFVFVSDGGAVFAGSSDMPLLVLEPEARLSWRQYVNDDEVWYVEPGVGLGAAMANLSLEGEGVFAGESFDEWDNTWTGRAWINVGTRVVGGLAGFQASYLRGGELDFAEGASGDLEEWFVGIFGALEL